MSKRILSITAAVCLVALCFAAMSGCTGKSDPPPGVAAVYGDTEITWENIEMTKDLMMFYGQSGDQLPTNRELVEERVRDIITEEEALRRGLTVTQEEIDDFIQGQKDTHEIPEVKEAMEEYFTAFGLTEEEYFRILEEGAPSMLLKGKLSTELKKEFCQQNGLEYTEGSTPMGMLEYVDDYLDQLFEANKHKIVYYLDAKA